MVDGAYNIRGQIVTPRHHDDAATSTYLHGKFEEPTQKFHLTLNICYERGPASFRNGPLNVDTPRFRRGVPP